MTEKEIFKALKGRIVEMLIASANDINKNVNDLDELRSFLQFMKKYQINDAIKTIDIVPDALQIQELVEKSKS